MSKNLNADHEKEIDDLVDALDALMFRGNGHVNVIVDQDAKEIKVQTANSTEFSCQSGACAQPTEDLDE